MYGQSQPAGQSFLRVSLSISLCLFIPVSVALSSYLCLSPTLSIYSPTCIFPPFFQPDSLLYLPCFYICLIVFSLSLSLSLFLSLSLSLSLSLWFYLSVSMFRISCVSVLLCIQT